MALIYSRFALTTIIESIPRTQVKLSVWHTLNHLGISSSKTTRRGCRGGRRKTTANVLSTSYSPSEKNLALYSTTSILQNIIHRNAGNLHNASSNLLNIQVVTSATIIAFEETGSPAGFPAGHEIFQIIEPRLRNIENLVYIKPNVQPSTPKKSLNFGNVNARSLRNKTDVFIDHVIANSIDVCVVTETWLNDNDDVSLASLSPQGYIFKNIPRKSRNGGGTGIIFRECFDVNFIKGNHNLSFESSEWNLSAHGRVTKFIAIYRPPYSEMNPMSTSVFFQEFTTFLENTVLCSELLIIAGDFNIHVNDSSNSDSHRFADVLETFGLTQHIMFATHNSGHCLDLIITRSLNDIMVCSPRPSLFLSDHCFAECSLEIPSSTAMVKEISFRKLKDLDLAAFKNDITASELYKLPSSQLAANYSSILQDIYDKHAPLQRKILTVRPRIPWFNNALKEMKRSRRKLEKKMRKSNLPSDISAYKRACNEYCAALKNAKSRHYSNLIEECAGDSKKLFKVVNSLCKERIDNHLPHYTCPRQLADDFGEYFCHKITLIKEKIQRCTNESEPSIVVSPPKAKITRFDYVSDDTINKIILSASNASCKLDPIPSSLVKKCIDQLAPIIARMINSSLETGSFPDNWKTALIVPLLKKQGLDLVFSNFRPVSNLPFVAKIAEKAVLSQILGHCVEHAPLPANQSAYRQYHSTETTLLRVHNDILMNMDRQEITLLVLLDLSSAFDTIDYSTMGNILENDFGITSTALSWLMSFLSPRQQRVVIDNVQSRDFPLSSGVPQGSCLGPILFIIYASRLFHIAKKHLPSVQCYADDIQLYISFRPSSEFSADDAIKAMEAIIVEFRAWMASHHLQLNDIKTEFTIIGSQHQLSKVNIEGVLVGSSVIKPAESVRNLGAWFDSTMSMNTHVGKVCSKAFRGLYNIRQIRKFLSEDATKTLVHAFVTSHIDYCNSLLYNIPRYQIDRLQKIMNAAARIVCFIPRFCHITSTLVNLHWLPVHFRIDFKIALLVYKILQGQAPSYLADLIHLKTPSRYSLRCDNQLFLEVPRTKRKTFGDRAFASAAPKIWNALPLSIRLCNTIDTFKSQLKTHYFQMAYK